jgi:hypothetical protein
MTTQEYLAEQERLFDDAKNNDCPAQNWNCEKIKQKNGNKNQRKNN